MLEKLSKAKPLVLQIWMLSAVVAGIAIGMLSDFLFSGRDHQLAIILLAAGVIFHSWTMYEIYFSKKIVTPIERPKNICPNCWGYYEYADKIRKDIYDEEIAMENHETVRSFIMGWVKKNLEGIHLKREKDELVCLHCNTRYSNVNV